jgi:hypothetical protein
MEEANLNHRQIMTLKIFNNMYEIEIFDKANHHLSFGLKDIISLLNSKKYSTLNWSVFPSLELYNGPKDLPHELCNFYDKVLSAKKPIHAEWSLINFIANNVLQVTDGTFVGDDLNTHIEITAHDSTLWSVKTNDKEVYESVLNRFKDTKVLNEN